MSNTPLVSIRLMTYNHEMFIREAIEGVLKQDVDFLVHIVVGDDFSTDETLNIIKEYKDTEYIKIKILNRQKGDSYWVKRKKEGRLINFVNIIENCEGKYIALLDGDDYWVDELKLRKQVEFLEKNPEFIVSFHNSFEIDDNNIINNESTLAENNKKDLSSNEMALGAKMPTATVVFRKGNLIKDFPSYFTKVSNGDTFLFYLLSNYGIAHYHHDIKKAAYRFHSGGIWTTLTDKIKLQNRINTYLHIYYHNKREDLDSKLAIKLSKVYYGALGVLIRERNIKDSILYFIYFLVFYYSIFSKKFKLSVIKNKIQ